MIRNKRVNLIVSLVAVYIFCNNLWSIVWQKLLFDPLSHNLLPISSFLLSMLINYLSYKIGIFVIITSSKNTSIFGPDSLDLICVVLLWKLQALAKYKYLQSLEHTSQFIEKLEKELEDYHNHLARFNQTKHNNAIANQPSLG